MPGYWTAPRWTVEDIKRVLPDSDAARLIAEYLWFAKGAVIYCERLFGNLCDQRFTIVEQLGLVCLKGKVQETYGVLIENQYADENANVDETALYVRGNSALSFAYDGRLCELTIPFFQE
jgi:hypothetical protein